MKVLLAGATGAVGRPLLSALAAAGHEVLAIIRDPAKSGLVTSLGAEPVHADVLDRDGLLRAVDGLAADVVMHQATALKDVGRKLRADDPTNRLRDEGTRHLLAAAGVVGAGRFVAQSLITGYGYRDHGTRLLTESDVFGEPVGNAGDVVVAASVAAERQPLEAPGIESVALRYGMFYGPGGFSDMFAGFLRKRIPLLPMSPTAVTGFIHVADAAAAAVAAMERGKPGAAYNLVDDEPLSWREFVMEVARAHGTPRPWSMPAWLLRRVSPYVGLLMVDATFRLSHAKATEELGWTPKYRSVREGLAAGGLSRN